MISTTPNHLSRRVDMISQVGPTFHLSQQQSTAIHTLWGTYGSLLRLEGGAQKLNSMVPSGRLMVALP